VSVVVVVVDEPRGRGTAAAAAAAAAAAMVGERVGRCEGTLLAAAERGGYR